MARCLLFYLRLWDLNSMITRRVPKRLSIVCLYLDQIKLYCMQPNLKYETFVSAGFTICTVYDSHCPCRPCQRTGKNSLQNVVHKRIGLSKICLPHSLTVCTRTEKLLHISGMWFDNSSAAAHLLLNSSVT